MSRRAREKRPGLAPNDVTVTVDESPSFTIPKSQAFDSSLKANWTHGYVPGPPTCHTTLGKMAPPQGLASLPEPKSRPHPVSASGINANDDIIEAVVERLPPAKEYVVPPNVNVFAAIAPPLELPELPLEPPLLEPPELPLRTSTAGAARATVGCGIAGSVRVCGAHGERRDGACNPAWDKNRVLRIHRKTSTGNAKQRPGDPPPSAELPLIAPEQEWVVTKPRSNWLRAAKTHDAVPSARFLCFVFIAGPPPEGHFAAWTRQEPRRQGGAHLHGDVLQNCLQPRPSNRGLHVGGSRGKLPPQLWETLGAPDSRDGAVKIDGWGHVPTSPVRTLALGYSASATRSV
jgi:hypothetical protein